MYMNCDISVFIKFAFDSFVNEFVSNLRLHGRIGRGGGGEGGCTSPQKKFGQLRFFGQEEKFGQSQL